MTIFNKIFQRKHIMLHWLASQEKKKFIESETVKFIAIG